MTDTTKKDDGDTKMVEAVMNAKLPCGQYVFEAVDKAEVRAIIAVAKPMIERELLRALQNVAAGMPPEMQAGVHDAVDIVSEARGIDLEAE